MSRKLSNYTESEPCLDDVQHLNLDYVSWELYEHLLKATMHRRVRMTYDNGDLEIMSPLPEHEIPSRCFGYLICILAEETNTPLSDLGSTTFRRKIKKKGLEPDECFYIQHLSAIKGKKRISLPKDPPPDLAIEIEITNRLLPRLPIYAGLGIPEVWRYNVKTVACLLLGKDSEYHEAEVSAAFPMLKPSDLARFIKRAESEDIISAGKEFRKWVKKQGWSK